MIQKISDEDIAAFRLSEAFDEKWYLDEYPDVVQTGMDPAYHYLWIGSKLGRRSAPKQGNGDAQKPSEVLNEDLQFSSPVAAIPSSPVVKTGGSRTSSDPQIYKLISEEFSVDFYMTTYPDIALAKVDPVAHYIETGWREGRDPNISFSTRHYLESYPDIGEAGVNPFYHYIVAGRQEGREGTHALGYRYEILAKLKSVKSQIAELKSHRIPLPVSRQIVLDTALAGVVQANSGVMLSFSHDNFMDHVGGIQLILRKELVLLQKKGWSQVHVFSAYPLPFVDCSGDPVILGVLIDGAFVGYFLPETIAESIQTFAALPLSRRRFVVHSLLGMNIDQAIRIIDAAAISEGYFWLHDYAALYNNFKLLRNDIDYCGVPVAGSWAFELCEFARADFSQVEEFRKLFQRYKVHLVSPSQPALDIWQAAAFHETVSEQVLQHCNLVALPPESRKDQGQTPLKVGFLGFPVDHKGWSIFRELVIKFHDDPRYEFFHFGKTRQGGLPVTFVEVIGGAENPDGMRDAVEAHELDVALMWSQWPETYCLVAFEALAGGAALVGNPKSGNIAALIEATEGGMIISDDKELADAFTSGKIQALSRHDRFVQKYAIEYSHFTATFVEELK